MKYYIGVDPGQKGGLALLGTEGVVEFTKMPDTVAQIGQWLDNCAAQVSTAEIRGIIVELSQPMPGQGVVSVFTYGRHFGCFEAFAVGIGLPYHEVRPSKWKKEMGLSSDKLDSIMLCQRLFPTVNLIPEGCRKPSDGIAESVLIAEYGRRMNL